MVASASKGACCNVDTIGSQNQRPRSALCHCSIARVYHCNDTIPTRLLLVAHDTLCTRSMATRMCKHILARCTRGPGQPSVCKQVHTATITVWARHQARTLRLNHRPATSPDEQRSIPAVARCTCVFALLGYVSLHPLQISTY